MYLLTGSDGARVTHNTLEEAYNDVVARIVNPEKWHRMLLHHVRELFSRHTVPNTRLIVEVAFTDDKTVWYEIQLRRNDQALHSGSPRGALGPV